jgi:hypothetical protein
MSRQDDQTMLCGRVFDRLVEGHDLSGDPLLDEHLGSCVTCFRALTELRDAPRVAEALRAEAPLVPRPEDRFWDELAARTTAAAEAALRSAEGPTATAASSVRERARRASGTRVRIFSVAATLAAAAAGFLVVARRPVPSAPVQPGVSALVAAGAAGAAADRRAAGKSGHDNVASSRSRGDDAAIDDEADVADLDPGALRRLLDRMRPPAPAALTSPGGAEAGEGADALGDEEGRMNDELADLDRDELRRVASSLEGGAW